MNMFNEVTKTVYFCSKFVFGNYSLYEQLIPFESRAATLFKVIDDIDHIHPLQQKLKCQCVVLLR